MWWDFKNNENVVFMGKVTLLIVKSKTGFQSSIMVMHH